MAKEKKTGGQQPRSLADFNEENLLNSISLEDDPVEIVDTDEPEDVDNPEGGEPEKVVAPAAGKDGKKTPEAVVDPAIDPVDPDKDEPEGDEIDPVAFYADVEKIHGIAVDVDFGTVDPLSAQGVAMRDQALMEKALDDFFDKLEDMHPKAYKALEYSLHGGDISELFTVGEKDYTKIQIAEDDEAHAKQILSEYYQRKGITEKKIQRLIEADEESDEGVIKTAQGALKEMQDIQLAAQEEKLKARQAQDAIVKAQNKKMLGDLSQTIGSMKLNTFQIPNKKEAEAFFDFVRSGIQRLDDGTYVITVPLDNKNLESQLQAEYFRFKKGDLSQLIQTKANSQQAMRLGQRAKAEKQTPASTQNPSGGRTLKDYDAE